MRLTKSGKTLQFIDHQRHFSYINLYGPRKEEPAAIEFFETKANVCQLWQLLKTCEEFKTKQSKDGLKDENATPFVNEMNSQIAEYIKENTTS